MSKIFLVFRQEVFRVTGRVPYWLGVFGPLVLGLMVAAGLAFINSGQKNGGSQAALQNVAEILSVKDDLRPRGYFDPAQLIKIVPANFPQEFWFKYQDEASALVDLNAGRIGAYYVIPADYVKSGQVELYLQKYRISSGGTRADEFEKLLSYNLLNGNVNLLNAGYSALI